MAVVKNSKPRKKTTEKGKKLTAEELRQKRSELVREATRLAIDMHRDALKELARH